jgi:hypothetical protein
MAGMMFARLSPLVFLLLLGSLETARPALPRRLILALDGIPFRDMTALQAGVTYTNLNGKVYHRQGFTNGYFPASRMVSTFPSASDVAWSEMFHNSPLPGYQRTYFSHARNALVRQNGVTTTMEYEKQMTWEIESGFLRALGYVFPRRTFKYEAHELVKHFLKADNAGENYYALLRSPDDAQHLSADLFALLCTLDEKLEQLRAVYRKREGRELEVLILSDHGNNHAGPAKRVRVKKFLKAAGYHLASKIERPKDVVLPTAGMESWVEMHNAPEETERLLEVLSKLEGADILTGVAPGPGHRFMVMNRKGERAEIDWNPDQNSFRYRAQNGDPLGYGPVRESLARLNKLDADGFGTAETWAAETFALHYPNALERIVRGHTRAALNPATLIISLDNAYLHSGWFVKQGSDFVRFGGTHGALDDLNSTGMWLSNFAPPQDTCAVRVADLFGGFPGRRDYRAGTSGAEWVYQLVPRNPAGRNLGGGEESLPQQAPFLRVWDPRLAATKAEPALEVTLQKNRSWWFGRLGIAEQYALLPTSSSAGASGLRLYALPTDFTLEPKKEYRISGRLQGDLKGKRLFRFTFETDSHGSPIAD